MDHDGEGVRPGAVPRQPKRTGIARGIRASHDRHPSGHDSRLMSGSLTRLIVVAYDPEWPAAFAAEAARLRAALGTVALRVDHHGSTAVPGLAAKPIIDIQISVAALEPLSAYGSRLEAIG